MVIGRHRNALDGIRIDYHVQLLIMISILYFALENIIYIFNMLYIIQHHFIVIVYL